MHPVCSDIKTLIYDVINNERRNKNLDGKSFRLKLLLNKVHLKRGRL